METNAAPRSGAGQRHGQTFVLVLTLMNTVSGYSGYSSYRAIGDYSKRNRQNLSALGNIVINLLGINKNASIARARAVRLTANDRTGMKNRII